MIRPVQTSAPAAEPVTLAEVKSHLRVDHEDDDTMIASLISGAVADLDGYAGVLGRCMVSQEWRQDFKEWDWRFRLPFPNVSAAAIAYQDADNATQAVAADQFEIIETHRGAEIVFKDAFQEPSTYDDVMAPISVTFTTGYGDAADVPDDIKVAIWLMVELDYEPPVQQQAEAMRRAIDAKIEKHRWVTV